MSQTSPMPPPGFDDLSVQEQIDYVQALWDHIATIQTKFPCLIDIKRYSPSHLLLIAKIQTKASPGKK